MDVVCLSLNTRLFSGFGETRIRKTGFARHQGAGHIHTASHVFLSTTARDLALPAGVPKYFLSRTFLHPDTPQYEMYLQNVSAPVAM